MPSCAAPKYRYSALQDGHIRLLRLMPNQDEHAPIQCQLFHYHLLDSAKGTHLYEALSYVWGSPKKPRFIVTNEGHLPVTENLYAALSRLRDHSLQRVIWTDAICINQGDMKERERQVQSMAKIYAGANRVIVWLEEATTGCGPVDKEAIRNSHHALEELGAAARGVPPKPSGDETKHQAVLSLLQHSWFRRIWVLQEVAAARHVLIMCHSTEIDGYAFCFGLQALNLDSEDAHLQSRIRSTIYLIKGAIFRPKATVSHPDRFSLHIRPLGEPVDMYHNRDATDRRDKIYALLGMSSDIPVGLSPDYTKSWKDIFYQLIKSFMGERASVETCDEDEIAVIKTKASVLGEIKTPGKSTWDERQSVDVALKRISGCFPEWSGRWTLQSSAKPIQEGDFVCLLQGAPKPTIIRLCEDYCVIVAIAVTPTDDERAEGAAMDWPNLLQRITTFPRDVFLVWDWETSQERVPSRGDYKCLLRSRVSRHAKPDTCLDGAARLASMGLLLRDVGKYEEASQK
ncbi:uncharacterized protein NECHADRAFT_54101, partial [Fusarium vanettenii 77-13-4]